LKVEVVDEEVVVVVKEIKVVIIKTKETKANMTKVIMRKVNS
jgi:hypothetical protein